MLSRCIRNFTSPQLLRFTDFSICFHVSVGNTFQSTAHIFTPSGNKVNFLIDNPVTHKTNTTNFQNPIWLLSTSELEIYSWCVDADKHCLHKSSMENRTNYRENSPSSQTTSWRMSEWMEYELRLGETSSRMLRSLSVPLLIVNAATKTTQSTIQHRRTRESKKRTNSLKCHGVANPIRAIRTFAACVASATICYE